MEYGERMTNRDYIIELLYDKYFCEDNGEAYEYMIIDHIRCPHYKKDKKAYCRAAEDCLKCKENWLNSEVDYDSI